MRSTSVHRLNADKLPRHLHFPWLALNWLNNHFFPRATNCRLDVRDFVADTSEEHWRLTDVKSSPARKLSDLFWLQLPWEAIQKELGQINVLDVGCGSGSFGAKLQAYSQSRIARYTGIDISRHDSWDALAKQHPGFRFHQVDSSHLLQHLPGNTTLFVTQSAIEHFEQDFWFFEQVRQFVRQTSRSIIQVHLFPSSACLRLYLIHGVRQYNPRMVSMIVRLFLDTSHAVLYRLGGRECNRVHWEFITRPLVIQKIGDLRETRTEEYDRRLRQAIAADNNRPHCHPSFYALVVHSNGRHDVFT